MSRYTVIDSGVDDHGGQWQVGVINRSPGVLTITAPSLRALHLTGERAGQFAEAVARAVTPGQTSGPKVSSGYQMCDAIGPTPDGRVVEVGYDGPLVRLHVHGGQSAALDAGQRDQFMHAWALAESQAEAHAIEAAEAVGGG